MKSICCKTPQRLSSKTVVALLSKSFMANQSKRSGTEIRIFFSSHPELQTMADDLTERVIL